jgi:hypothetical protein
LDNLTYKVKGLLLGWRLLRCAAIGAMRCRRRPAMRQRIVAATA